MRCMMKALSDNLFAVLLGPFGDIDVISLKMVCHSVNEGTLQQYLWTNRCCDSCLSCRHWMHWSTSQPGLCLCHLSACVSANGCRYTSCWCYLSLPAIRTVHDATFKTDLLCLMAYMHAREPAAVQPFTSDN